MKRNRQFAHLAALTALCLSLEACQRDLPTGSPVVSGPAVAVADLAVEGLDPSGSCPGCLFEPHTFVRSRGAPRSQTVGFLATAGHSYVVDLDDLGSQGADATVTLNGQVFISARETGAASRRHYTDTLQLKRANTITARLVGKPGSKLRVAVWPVRTVTLDAVTLASGAVLQIGGPGTTFNSTITNHTAASLVDVHVVTSVWQGSARRAAGDALVTCGASPGVLPAGTCIRTGDAIVPQNTGSGSGTLVAGAAEAVIEVRDAASVLDSVRVPIELTTTGTSTITTGIRDIRSFLDVCPTDDPAYGQIRQDFEIRVDGKPDTVAIVCTGSYSTLPVDQLTDELIVMQVLRTAYYMSNGTEGRLPWTQLGLYDWMKSHVGGINLRTTLNYASCCLTFDGKNYFNWPRLDASTRNSKRTWPGIATLLAVYAHEVRHADPNAPGHLNGCPAFPLPTDAPGCDATYDLSNLGSYGVQYWLFSNWAVGYLNIGIACSPSTAQEYATSMANNANLYPSRFVANPPPMVAATEPYGGTCVTLLSANN